MKKVTIIFLIVMTTLIAGTAMAAPHKIAAGEIYIFSPTDTFGATSGTEVYIPGRAVNGTTPYKSFQDFFFLKNESNPDFIPKLFVFFPKKKQVWVYDTDLATKGVDSIELLVGKDIVGFTFEPDMINIAKTGTEYRLRYSSESGLAAILYGFGSPQSAAQQQAKKFFK